MNVSVQYHPCPGFESEYLGEEYFPYKSRRTGCAAVSQAEIGQDPSAAAEGPGEDIVS
jgi:hypothetical protein